MWPPDSALFIYVLTHCIETFKKLYYNQDFQLTLWCRGNASPLGATSPGFNFQLRQRFLFDFLFCCYCVFTFLSQNTLFVTKLCNFFCSFSLCSIHITNKLVLLIPSPAKRKQDIPAAHAQI